MQQVRVAFTKWGGLPHWEFDAHLLGADEHGTWVGIRAGTLVSRPGASFHAPQDQLGLAAANGRHHATFYAPVNDPPCSVYVDLTHAGSFDGRTMTAVDMDLDVIRGATGRLWVDDEDEFADHRVRFGYPDEVVRAVVEECARVRRAVAAAVAPYDEETVLPWFARLAALTG